MSHTKMRIIWDQLKRSVFGLKKEVIGNVGLRGRVYNQGSQKKKKGKKQKQKQKRNKTKQKKGAGEVSG